MKKALSLVCWLMTLGALVAEVSYQSEFYAARKQRDANRDEAEETMKRAFRMAVEAGNADYATAAGNSACFWMYERGRTVEAGKFAREVIDAIQPMGYHEKDNDALRRAVLFGYFERGLLMEGKIGAAWQANRATAENLRGNPVGANGDGRSITVEDVAKLPADRRSLGWRLVEREADILDYMGRSHDARALLDEAAKAAGDDWRNFRDHDRFYIFKLLARRCELLDYLGYEFEAIEAQRALLIASEGLPLRSSPLTLRINLLRNLSQWDGPTEEILTEARELATRIDNEYPGNATKRLLAKMELDLKHSQEAMDTLRNEARNAADLGHFLESAYAARDSLVTRAKTGEAGLDEEFISVLNRMREQGNKRGEPVLYQEYGGYLLQQNRPGEAIAMFQEALRLKRAFGLMLHEAPLLGLIFKARFQAGDTAGAEATLNELQAFIQQNQAEMPIARRVHAETLRATALAQLGRSDEAKAVLELARRLGADLPPYRRMLLAPDRENRILNPDPISTPSGIAAIAPRLRIQPLEVVSVAALEQSATSRFLIANPTAVSISGKWILTGPGAVSTPPGSVAFIAGKPVTTTHLSTTIPGGGESKIIVTVAPAPGITEESIQVSWHPAAGEASPASSWDVSWQPDTTGRIVLDASLLETNPFRSVSLFHELASPIGEDVGIPFRLRSPVPLRLEYYDVTSGELLAIDANGNGDFTESGDLHSSGPAGLACAIAPVRPDQSTSTLEIRIFAPSGEPLAITPALMLESEVHRGGKWIKEAESTLQ